MLQNIRRCGVVVMSALLAGCALPSLDGRTQSQALDTATAATTRLGQGVAADVGKYPGLTGILPLDDPLSSFAVRILLARAAERTLDLQYYIWRDDLTGRMLLRELRDAADRGVRVRLLLDDNGVSGMDSILSVLNAHPNIEVRLFNPFVVRFPKVIGFVTDFARLNRRMHNKAMIADNQMAVVGGRNIGDAYFAANGEVHFADLDIVSVGAVVTDVSADFDRYWASESSYPAERILPPVTDVAQERFAAMMASVVHEEGAHRYLEALRQASLIEDIVAGRADVAWVPVRMVSDDPAKGLGKAKKKEMLASRLMDVIGRPYSELVLVSPYFVPGEQGVAAFAAMRAQGVSVSILTNALEATDVTAVHAGYAKRRAALLSAGVRLYEMRRHGGKQVREKAGPFGSSGSSLHAKTFAVDRERLFVGSFNFDPRSVNLNTELGFVIDSPRLAAAVSGSFPGLVQDEAYAVQLDASGALVWLERGDDGSTIVHRSEPGAGIAKRIAVHFLSVLPIEGLL